MLLHQFFKFLKLLHSDTSTHQLSAGFVLGMFLGVTPALTLHWFCYFILLLVLRANIGAAMLSWAGFGILAFLLDPVFHKVGLYLLTQVAAVQPLWTTLYQTPLVPFTRFYNSIVMGSLAGQLLLAVPLFWISGVLIKKYRLVVVSRFKGTWMFRAWKASKLSDLYDKYQEFRG